MAYFFVFLYISVITISTIAAAKSAVLSREQNQYINVQNQYKKKLRAKLENASWESDYYMGSNTEKLNISIAILKKLPI